MSSDLAAASRESSGKSKDAAHYYRFDRAELYSFARACGLLLQGPVLNVGCAAGSDAVHLRSLGATEIHGVEPVPWIAGVARLEYDDVFAGRIEDYPWEHKDFDLIVFADVLEHLSDPGAILEEARQRLSPSGSILVSVPNARHLSVLWQLAVRGEWEYVDSGILDRTHLRFFTSRSFRRLLTVSNFETVAFARSGALRVTREIAQLIPNLGEFLLSQMFFLARPRQMMSGASISVDPLHGQGD
jgi:2-polyprenyl-3-methyl-5-hydroxy-6-metoxy-1,4-benzoquinol methylase